MAIELSAQKREVLGKKVNKLRKQDLIPAELYGRGVENKHLFVSADDFNRVFKSAGESAVVDLKVASEPVTKKKMTSEPVTSDQTDKIPVLIYNIQRHPVSDKALAVDFYQVRLDEKVNATVPIELTGEAPAIKDKDGVLLQIIGEVEVEALPMDIPKTIRVDLSPITELGQGIYIKDLKVEKGVKILAEPEALIVAVKPKMTEEEEKALEGAPADVSEVKVEGERKEMTSEPVTSDQ